MDSLSNALTTLRDFVWGPYLLIPLLLGVGLVLSLRLRGIHLRSLCAALRLGLIDRKDESAEGDISQYQALTTALAATVGTGNIVGVATAIAIGGPGALFWMWVTGVLGMATKYAETFLAVRYRTTDAAGEKSGGPQYYLERGLGKPIGRPLALSFAIFATLACFGIGNMTQGNAIAVNVKASWALPEWLTGAVLTVLTFIVLLGGIQSIGRVTARLVPSMILLYLSAGMFVLFTHAGAIPEALVLVFTDAFTGSAATGGFAGASLMIAMRAGIARGLFSNESGLGSAPMAAAAAQTVHPVRQGLVAMTQTFIDTLVMVTFTGLTLIVTGVWNARDPETGERMSAALMTSEAYAQGLPGDWGHYIVTLSLVLFAFSTILGWAYYGERNIERLFGIRAIRPYRFVFTVGVFIGCIAELDLVWTFSDLANGLMALPNLAGLLLLSGLVVRETRAYLHHDPKLIATKSEIEIFMEGRPEWNEWKASESAGAPKDPS